MIAYLALLAVVQTGSPQEGGGTLPEPRLHPADTVLLLELPDVQRMIAAYDRAPLVQLVQDEAVRETVADLLDSFEVDLAAQIGAVLTGLGLPAAFSADPGGALLAELAAIEALSFSISVDAERASELARYGMEALQATVELSAIQAQADRYREGGGWLTDLAVLELAPELATDPWGRPYVLGAEGRITSLGADGEEGGVDRDADLAADFDAAGYFSAQLPAAVGVLLHARFVSSEAAAHAAELCMAGLGDLGTTPGEATELEYSGSKGQLVALAFGVPELAQLPAWRLVAGRELAFGAGRVDAAGLARRRADPAQPSAASGYFDALVARLPAPQGAPLLQVGLASLASLNVLADLADAASEMSDVNVSFEANQKPGVLRMQLVGERFVNEVYFERDTESTSPTKHLASRPIPERLWKFVPEDAIGLVATTIDGAGLYAQLVAQGGIATRLAEIEQRHAFSLEKDVFKALGEGVVAYLLPIKGVAGIPEFAVAVELADPVAFQRGLEGLLALLNEQAAGEFEVKNKPYRDTPVWTFSFPNQGGAGGGAAMLLGLGFSPSVTIVDGYLVLTISSLRAKREIKRALGDEGGALALGAYAPPPDAVLYGYMDWAAFFNGLYDGVRGMAGLMGAMGGGELPFNPALLPEAGTFTRFFKPTTLWGQIVPAQAGFPAGFTLRHEASFGPETWLGVAGIGAAAFLGVRSSRSPQQFEIEVVEPTGPAQPEDAAKAEVTRATLQYLATRLAVHKLALERYPAQLADLAQPNASFPQGFLDGQPLPTDGWGRDFAYQLTPAGFELRSLGPDGVDQHGGGDDLVGG